MSGLIRHLNAELDDSVAAQVSRLEQERDTLAAQLQSGDFGLKSLFSREFWSNSTDVEGARRRLEEVNAALAVLQDRQRRDEVAADVAAEDASARAVAQQRQVLLDRLAAMHAETERKLADLSTDRITKISAAEEAEVRRLEGMRAEAAARGANPEELQRFDQQILAVRSLSLAERAAAEPKAELKQATDQEVDANQRLIDSLQGEIELLHLSERDRAIEQAARRLSADATDEQRAKVRELEAALYDEKEAMAQQRREGDLLNRLRQQLAETSGTQSEADRAAAQAVAQLGAKASDSAKAEAEALARKLSLQRDGLRLTEQMQDGEEAYARQIAHLDELLKAGAITADTYANAHEQAWRRMLAASTEWQDGVTRGWQNYRDAAYDGAAQAERVFTDATRGMEDVFVGFISRGELNFDNLTQRIIEDLSRIFWEREVIGPIGDALFGGDEGSGGVFTSLFGGLFHEGGVAGEATSFKEVPSWLIAGAPRYHSGGIAGLEPGEVPAVLKVGEVVGWPEQLRQAFGGATDIQATDARATYVVNVDARGASDPEATAALVQRAVAETLGRLVPGIVQQAATSAYGSVIDQVHRRGGRLS